MGFLDNVAMRKAERALRPFMRSDERLIEYDIANINPIGRRVPVILSNRAVYFQQGNQAIRIPYAEIVDVQALGLQMIAVATKSGNAYLLEIIGPPKGDLYDTITHHVDKSVKAVHSIEVPGGSLSAMLRRIEEDGPWVWLVGTSEGVDLENEHVRASVRDQLGPAIEESGVEFPWG